MKSEFLWHTATYFNVTVTTTYHPGYERPKRTGSQCSSISSSPHMRKARSSYLWTGFLIAANGKMFKKAWSSLLPPALQASYCSNIFQVQDAKSNLKKISCTLQAYSLHEKNKHQKLENNLNDHLVSCYIQGYSSLGNADLLAVGHQMALVPEVRYSLLCHPKQADAPSLCQWSPQSTNFKSARSVLKAWWERLCSQYSHLDKPRIVDDQRPKTLSPKFLWVWLTSNQKLPSPHLILEKQKGTTTLTSISICDLAERHCWPKRLEVSVHQKGGPNIVTLCRIHFLKIPSCWPLLAITELLEESPSWPILPWAVQLLYEVLGKQFLSIPLGPTWMSTWKHNETYGKPKHSTFDGAQQSTTSLLHITCLFPSSQFIKIVPLFLDSQNMVIQNIQKSHNKMYYTQKLCANELVAEFNHIGKGLRNVWSLSDCLKKNEAFISHPIILTFGHTTWHMKTWVQPKRTVEYWIVLYWLDLRRDFDKGLWSSRF